VAHSFYIDTKMHRQRREFQLVLFTSFNIIFSNYCVVIICDDYLLPTPLEIEGMSLWGRVKKKRLI